MSAKKEMTIGSIITISKGKKHSIVENPSEKSKRLLAIDDLRNDNLIRFTNDKKGTEAQPDDVLIAWDGANAGTIGYGKSGFIGSTIARLRFKERNHYCAPFIGAFLRSKFDYLRQTATGATIPHINRKALEGIFVPEIDYDEQKRIAHLLCSIEGLIARRKQHLQKLDDLLKSVFLEMFGDPIINPRKFPIRKMSEFYINSKEGTKCGPFGSALKKDEFVDSGIPVWNMDNIDPKGRMIMPFRMWITKEKYDKLASYSVIDGDIIISRAGTVGKMCVARMNGEPAIISTNLIRLRLSDELQPLYVVFLMTFCKGRKGRLKTGADDAFTHMNTGILDKLEFPYPPITLQNQFTTIVEKVESIEYHYQQSLSDFEVFYGALSQKAFKGELDLSRVPLPPESPETEELEEKDMETKQPAGQLFELPVPADFAGLQSSENRKELLRVWLTAWLKHLGETPFSVQSFMEVAQQRLSELLQDDIQGCCASDYDEIKSLVFKALAEGHLIQTYDDANNIVQIKAVPS